MLHYSVGFGLRAVRLAVISGVQGHFVYIRIILLRDVGIRAVVRKRIPSVGIGPFILVRDPDRSFPPPVVRCGAFGIRCSRPAYIVAVLVVPLNGDTGKPGRIRTRDIQPQLLSVPAGACRKYRQQGYQHDCKHQPQPNETSSTHHEISPYSASDDETCERNNVFRYWFTV